MKFCIIVAIDKNNGIGKGNDQLAYISADLKRFKALTSGHSIIMGRKTFEALPKGALPNRRNIVISRQSNYTAPNIEVVTSPQEAAELCKNEKEVFIIGGGEIYKMFLPDTSKIYLTNINHAFEGVDTFFPELPSSEWDIEHEEGPFIDEKSGLEYNYQNLVRL